MRPNTDRKYTIKQLLLFETKRLKDIRTAALRLLRVCIRAFAYCRSSIVIAVEGTVVEDVWAYLEGLCIPN
jgi:hypothetical protein